MNIPYQRIRRFLASVCFEIAVLITLILGLFGVIFAFVRLVTLLAGPTTFFFIMLAMVGLGFMVLILSWLHDHWKNSAHH